MLLLILRSGWALLRDSVRILLEGAPPGLDLAALQRDVQEHFPVRDMHHVHAWELNAGRCVLSAHVRLAEMPWAKWKRCSPASVRSRIGGRSCLPADFAAFCNHADTVNVNKNDHPDRKDIR